jgi:hypothetical protein
MLSIPIPAASAAVRAKLIVLVQKCLQKDGMDCAREEHSINELVAESLGITMGDFGNA